MPTIGVVIHTLNEENNIKECLESVKWVDEIIIIDMYSEDKTVQIAQSYGAKIYYHDKVRCVDRARNFGLSKVTSDWTLVVDADERVSEGLKNEIIKFINSPDNYTGLAIPRKNIMFGEWVKSLFPDYQIRLFQTGKGYWEGYVHNYAKVQGKIKELEPLEENSLIHYSYKDISTFLERLEKYSNCFVQDRIEQGKTFFPFYKVFQRIKKILTDRLKDLDILKESPHEFSSTNLNLFSEMVYYAKLWEGTKALDLKQKKPLYSIILVTYNNLELANQCINSLVKSIKNLDYEIIVIDNASTNTTYEKLTDNTFIKLHRNSEKLNMSECYNIGAKYSNGEYLVFLDSNTLVTDNWLNFMFKLYSNLSDVGLIGSKLTLIDKNTIYCGINIDSEFNLTLLTLTNEPKQSFEEVNALDNCILIKKEIFYKIGEFDKNLNDLAFIDLCFKVQNNGLKVYNCLNSNIFIYAPKEEVFYNEKEITYLKEKWLNKITPIKTKDKEYILKVLSNKEKEPELHHVDLSEKVELKLEKPINNKKTLLILTRYHRLKKGWSIIMQNIYRTGILHKNFNIHHLAWHTKQDEFIDNVKVYAETDTSEANNRLEEVINICEPDILLLHADPHFFISYQKTLKYWDGIKVPWVPIDGESEANFFEDFFQSCTEIITYTEYGKKELENKNGTKGKKIHVVKLGVNRNIFKPVNDGEKILIRRLLNLPEQGTIFLTVANNFWRKGVYNCVEGFDKFIKKYDITDAFLVLFTNPDKLLLNLINIKEDKVKQRIIIPIMDYDPFSKFLQDNELALYYNASDIFLLPSLAEGFGLPLLEAQSCGLPIIASNNSCIKEVVKEAGLLIDCPIPSTGMMGDYYVKQYPPNIFHLVELMYTLYKDKELRKELGNKGIKQSELYTWENVANNLNDILLNCINTYKPSYNFIYPEPEVIVV